MSEQEFLEAMEAIKQANERALASEAEARDVLLAEGVYDEKGNLTAQYAQR